MSAIFEMRPAIAYQELRREKSSDFAATTASILNFPFKTYKEIFTNIHTKIGQDINVYALIFYFLVGPVLYKN